MRRDTGRGLLVFPARPGDRRTAGRPAISIYLYIMCNNVSRSADAVRVRVAAPALLLVADAVRATHTNRSAEAWRHAQEPG